MMFLVPGSHLIPTFGVASTLVSVDAHAVLAAAACVGASLMLAAAAMRIQRLSRECPRRTPVLHWPVARHA